MVVLLDLFRQVHFDSLPSYEGLCYNGSYAGQRMLNIQMYFASDKSGWTFDIGDSPTNDGWGMHIDKCSDLLA